MAETAERLVCRSYTHARRHPMVLGRIAGWTPPFQLSLTQLGVLLATFGGAVWTWHVWAPRLPDVVAVMLLLVVPSAATWSVRRIRVEGRSLPRAALGWIALWSAPTSGTVTRRPYRNHRPTTWPTRWVFVATDPPRRGRAR